MSKDAINRRMQIREQRSFVAPWQEPLAMKLIRDEIGEAELPAHFLRNVLLFYVVLTELAAMRRSDGFQLHTQDINRMSGIEHHAHVQCRQFLEDLRLISVEEKMVEGGGGRKTVFVYMLPAPYADGAGTNRGDSGTQRPDAATEGPSEALPEKPMGPTPTIEVTEVSNTDSSSSLRSLLSSDASRGCEDPKSDDDGQVVDPGQQQPASSRVSLKSWTRKQIHAHHETSPDAPPAGTQCAQALMCAMATTPGAEAVLAVDFTRAYRRVSAALTRPYRKEFIILYRDWMDAALRLDAVPVPAAGEPTLEYWLGVMAAETLRRHTAAYETAHEEAGEEDGGDALTDEQIDEILQRAREST